MTLDFPALAAAAFAGRYQDWIASASRNHPELAVTINPKVAWSPLTRPLSECRVGLVTTTGVRRSGDLPFDTAARYGDCSFRPIPCDTDPGDLVVDHTHFDAEDAAADINCIFPVTRLRELAAAGLIGAVAPVHYSFMGFVPDPGPGLLDSARAAARALRDAGVAIALLTPG